jgi:hypothetical protein
VNRQLPHLGDAGQGVNRQLPHLGDAGQGVNRQLPHLGNGPNAFTHGGSGAPLSPWVNMRPDEPALYGYMHALAAKLRGVRVCCGDWARVVTDGALSYGGKIGIFLDPPYLGDVRTADLYACDDHAIANEVREWCLANGNNPRLRIVLAGYNTEHDHLMPDTWRRVRWTGTKAYGTTSQTSRNEGSENRHKETLWLSPACVGIESDNQLSIFDVAQP